MKQKLTALLLSMLLVLVLAVPVFAAGEQIPYVNDMAGLLTAEEQAELNDYAAAVSDAYDCAVYIVTADSLAVFEESSDAYWAAVEYYHGNELGYGTQRDGIVLLLGMRWRDYALFVYGNNAEYAFDEYGLIELEEEFLDDFGVDNWEDGFEDYIESCEEFLQKAADGDPVRKGNGKPILISIVISAVIALIVCAVNWSKMKVHKQTEAQAYITEQGLNLTEERDQFIRRSVTRRKVSSSSSGGSSRSGGGGHGRSGKF